MSDDNELLLQKGLLTKDIKPYNKPEQLPESLSIAYLRKSASRI